MKVCNRKKVTLYIRCIGNFFSQLRTGGYEVTFVMEQHKNTQETTFYKGLYRNGIDNLPTVWFLVARTTLTMFKNKIDIYMRRARCL